MQSFHLALPLSVDDEQCVRAFLVRYGVACAIRVLAMVTDGRALYHAIQSAVDPSRTVRVVAEWTEFRAGWISARATPTTPGLVPVDHGDLAVIDLRRVTTEAMRTHLRHVSEVHALGGYNQSEG